MNNENRALEGLGAVLGQPISVSMLVTATFDFDNSTTESSPPPTQHIVEFPAQQPDQMLRELAHPELPSLASRNTASRDLFRISLSSPGSENDQERAEGASTAGEVDLQNPHTNFPDE